MSAKSSQQTKYEKFIYASRAIAKGLMTVDEALAKGAINDTQAVTLRQKYEATPTTEETTPTEAAATETATTETVTTEATATTATTEAAAETATTEAKEESK